MKTQRRTKFDRWLIGASLSLVVWGCGEKATKSGSGGSSLGVIQSQFVEVATKYQIPVRMLLAVGFLESDLIPMPSSANYRDEKFFLGIPIGETAFGLDYKTLGISENPDKATLKVQLEAYGLLLRQRIDELDVDLDPNTSDLEQKFEWIWQIAKLQRGGRDGFKKNIQVVFTTELMDLLNRGYKWQDPTTGEVIELTKENPPIQVKDLPVHIRDNLKLHTDSGEITGVQRFELTYQMPENKLNKPTHIRVIHCPFPLSACLELQNKSETNESARLMAHYIIPPEETILDKPLQVASLSQGLLMTNNQGRTESIQDAVIIMLTGQSGRYVASKREKARPDWFTKWQLRHMGVIIGKVCQELANRFGKKQEQCRKADQKDGVYFVNQGPSEAFQWGDIPDYDENIFWPYINAPETLEGKLAIEMPTDVFVAGTEIPIKIQFIKETTQLRLELAERCDNQRIIWSTQQVKQVRGTNAAQMGLAIFDRGPNGNGEHFVKATAYNVKGQLLGWVIQNIFVTNYADASATGPSVRDCQRN